MLQVYCDFYGSFFIKPKGKQQFSSRNLVHTFCMKLYDNDYFTFRSEFTNTKDVFFLYFIIIHSYAKSDNFSLIPIMIFMCIYVYSIMRIFLRHLVVSVLGINKA